MDGKSKGRKGFAIDYRNQTVFCRNEEDLYKEIGHRLDQGDVPLTVSTGEEWKTRHDIDWCPPPSLDDIPTPEEFRRSLKVNACVYDGGYTSALTEIRRLSREHDRLIAAYGHVRAYARLLENELEETAHYRVEEDEH